MGLYYYYLPIPVNKNPCRQTPFNMLTSYLKVFEKATFLSHGKPLFFFIACACSLGTILDTLFGLGKRKVMSKTGLRALTCLSFHQPHVCRLRTFKGLNKLANLHEISIRQLSFRILADSYDTHRSNLPYSTCKRYTET